MSARQIADHKHLGRGAANTGNVRALEAGNPDHVPNTQSPENGQVDQGEETGS